MANTVKWFFVSLTAFIICGTLIFIRSDWGSGIALPSLTPEVQTQEIPKFIDYAAVDEDVTAAVMAARDAAIQAGTEDLATWKTTLMRNVDEKFLPDFFGYFNTLGSGISDAARMGVQWLWDKDTQKVAERRAAIVQKDFEAKVVQPVVVEQRLKFIAQDMVEVFQQNLSGELANIPKRYEINASEWDEYLSRIRFQLSSANGENVDLDLRALKAGMVLSGTKTATFALAVAPAVKTTVSAKMAAGAAATAAKGAAAKAAGTAATAAATKGGVAAGGSWAGPIGVGVALVGIAGWEAWTHHDRLENDLPALRAQIDQSFTDFNISVLEPTGPLGAVVHGLSAEIIKSMTNR